MQKEDVLKVSPFTKLPTKADCILIMRRQEVMKIHMQNYPTNSSPIKEMIAPTNSSPIHMRLIGSAEHVIVGKPWRIYTNPAIHPHRECSSCQMVEILTQPMRETKGDERGRIG
ncbi:hypothetical protein [uncultured Proteiniphilum sp.]|uniref:hypothetical protein n=1 Tax=uncultured Proteiniphilum sp. TaxID=497637 RepID=UPI00263532B0|nr:hypothetical protein [uncultured Proteiniphilum sp.]